MIAIENVLVSDEIVKKQFVCDLSKCKGACCVDGDAGAPLNKNELKKIDDCLMKCVDLLFVKHSTKKKLQSRVIS